LAICSNKTEWKVATDDKTNDILKRNNAALVEAPIKNSKFGIIQFMLYRFLLINLLTNSGAIQ
jgi:hypothetical protein